MPWKDHSVMEQRWKFVQEWQTGDWNMAELCRFHGVARGTGYKWVERYEAEGLEGMRDRSRLPHRRPNEVGEELEDLVIRVREQHPRWGAPKIRARLQRERGGERIPAESTIGAILKRHGLTVPKRAGRRRHGPVAEPLSQAEGPNTVWCADYKGWFRCQDGTRIDPLTISDAYSRYLFRCQAVRSADYAHSKPVFEAAFREYGMPVRMRTDNGAPFGSNGDSGLTGLTVWWIKLGIAPEHIAPGKPQQNGRHERMHRTLKEETASPPARTRRAQQQRFDEFRQEYNEQRPHQALGQATPASHYQISGRTYPERIREVEYPPDWDVRVVDGGRIRWSGERVFVSHALGGERVGLERIEERQWRVWFSFHELGVLEAGQSRLRRGPQQGDRERPRGATIWR